MWLKLSEILGAALALFGVIFFARRDARKSEQIKHIKEEAERTARERDKKDEITNRVSNMSDDDVCQRLQNVASKQR